MSSIRSLNDIEFDNDADLLNQISLLRQQRRNRSLLYKLLSGTIAVGSVFGMMFLFRSNINHISDQQIVSSTTRQTLETNAGIYSHKMRPGFQTDNLHKDPKNFQVVSEYVQLQHADNGRRLRWRLAPK